MEITDRYERSGRQRIKVHYASAAGADVLKVSNMHLVLVKDADGGIGGIAVVAVAHCDPRQFACLMFAKDAYRCR